jgi:hypothetical protein
MHLDAKLQHLSPANSLALHAALQHLTLDYTLLFFNVPTCRYASTLCPFHETKEMDAKVETNRKGLKRKDRVETKKERFEDTKTGLKRKDRVEMKGQD